MLYQPQPSRNLHSRTNRSGSRSRGVAIMLVTITLVICTVLAMSFLSANQTSTAIAMNVRNQSLARAVSESGLDMTSEYIRANHDWRDKFNEGIWINNEPFADGTFTISVYDLLDNDLANDLTHPAMIASIGRVGSVTHTSRANIRPHLILLSHWKMDEPVGSTTLVDEKGAHNGSYLNAPTLGEPGMVGTCSYFPGVTGQIRHGLIADSPDFKLKNGAIACWFKTQKTTGAQGIVSRDTCAQECGGGHIMIWL